MSELTSMLMKRDFALSIDKIKEVYEKQTATIETNSVLKLQGFMRR